MRRSLLLVASFFVLSSSASDARPSRPSVNVSECNITMPATSPTRKCAEPGSRRNAETNRALRRELFHIEPSWRK